jgi:integrase
MKDDVQIVLNPEMYIVQIQSLQRELNRKDKEIRTLMIQLDYERELRMTAENRLQDLNVSVDERPVVRRKSRKQATQTKEYTDFKSDGKRKAHAADSIRSYDDFSAIQKYYLESGRVRDWAMWTIGVSLGLRISDLLSLRFKNIIENDRKTFKARINIYEQKTGKMNDCLITESVKHAMTRYLDSIKWEFDLDGFLFPSRKTKGKMYEEYGWKILSDAGRALNLPIVIGSHTMRKSFANIAACVDKSCIDMNSITKVQGLLNHSDQRVTMKYLGSYQEMFDRARIAVSDFVLGKTNVNEIVAGNQHTIDDVFERMDALEKILCKGNSTDE